MALIKNIVREHKVHERAINVIGANAGEVYFTGAYILREAATALATVAAPGAGMIPLGVVVEPLFPADPADTSAHLDNSAAADGVVRGDTQGSERVVRYDQRGEYAFTVDSGMPKPEDPAYLVDDDTVDTADPGHGIVAGVFTRPAPRAGQWFIDIARRSA